MRGPAVVFAVHVIPRATRDAVAGLRDGRLVIRLKAPPVDDAANRALVRFLAARLDVPRSAIAIERGHAARQKTIRIAGVDRVRVASLALPHSAPPES